MTTEDENNDETFNSNQEDPTILCPICMEEWTVMGEHRICSTKCGHFYGRSCIEKWLKERNQNSKCPNCNKPLKKSDLRDHYCKNIKVLDNSELAKLQEELEREKKLRKTDSATIFRNGMTIEILHKELSNLKQAILERDAKISKLQRVIDNYNKTIIASRSDNDNQNSFRLQSIPDLECQEENIIVDEITPKELKGQFHLADRIVACPTGGCKAFSLCPTASIILIAQPAPQGGARNLFAPFGLRRYSTLDTNIKEYIPLHSQPITSIQLKPIGDLILTAGLDKRVRLTSISNNACIQSYSCDYEPTCVAWSAHRDQQFYVASANCFVTLFDIRNTSEYIYQTSQRVAKTKILSAAATSAQDMNGIIVNDNKGSQYLELSENSSYELESIDRSIEHLTSLNLPFEGLMGTVDFNKRLNLTLISIRRTSTNPNSTHNLIQLQKSHNEEGLPCVKARSIRSFSGGATYPGEHPLLSHSRILNHPTLPDNVLVGAADQASNGVKLWDSTDNTEYQTIKTDRYVRDMLMYSPENSNQHTLYLLSDVGLNVYRWDYA